jgi:rod shape-determining protein MreC
VRRWVQGVPTAGAHEGTIEHLRSENAALRGQIAALQADRRTATQLAALQRAATTMHHRLLPARVVALGPGQGFDWTITLDVGTRDGARAGQTVTDGAGLVGRVLSADKDSSLVLLAADPGSGVGVRDLRTGEVGVATGHGAGGFTFAPLRPGADVRVGDALSTGPTDASSYVQGISVGTVRSVKQLPGGVVRADVRPTTSPTAVDLVAVIVDGGGPTGLAERGTR